MIIGYAPGSLRQHFDRGPSWFVADNAFLATAPHGFTNRQTRTVDAGKIGRVGAIWLHVRRVTAAAPVGIARINVLVLDNLGNNIWQTSAFLYTNGVNDVKEMIFGVEAYPPASGQVVISTEDTSTGGTVDYRWAVEFMQFNAA